MQDHFVCIMNCIALHCICRVVVQVLCSYVTLPLYALVSQVGRRCSSSFFFFFTRYIYI